MFWGGKADENSSTPTLGELVSWEGSTQGQEWLAFFWM